MATPDEIYADFDKPNVLKEIGANVYQANLSTTENDVTQSEAYGRVQLSDFLSAPLPGEASPGRALLKDSNEMAVYETARSDAIEQAFGREHDVDLEPAEPAETADKSIEEDPDVNL